MLLLKTKIKGKTDCPKTASSASLHSTLTLL